MHMHSSACCLSYLKSCLSTTANERITYMVQMDSGQCISTA